MVCSHCNYELNCVNVNVYITLSGNIHCLKSQELKLLYNNNQEKTGIIIEILILIYFIPISQTLINCSSNLFYLFIDHVER